MSAVGQVRGINQQVPTHVGATRTTGIFCANIAPVASIGSRSERHTVDGCRDARDRSVGIDSPTAESSNGLEYSARGVRYIDADTGRAWRRPVGDLEACRGNERG